LATLGSSPAALHVALARRAKKGHLANPRHGFHLILRPEDRAFGASDPARWIDPLMKSMKLDYRITLLRAAAFHGSSHPAAMVFQVIVPRQMRRAHAPHAASEWRFATYSMRRRCEAMWHSAAAPRSTRRVLVGYPRQSSDAQYRATIRP
jgi:hypothetical protein